MEEQKLREQEIMLTAGTGMNFNEESKYNKPIVPIRLNIKKKPK